MIDIFNDLSDLKIPVYAEGDAPAELPDVYLTINEDSTSDHLSADNEPKEYLYEYTIKYYTTDATTLYSGLLAIMGELKSKGYIVSGVGYANSTYQDKWFSRQADIKRIEYLQEAKL